MKPTIARESKTSKVDLIFCLKEPKRRRWHVSQSGFPLQSLIVFTPLVPMPVNRILGLLPDAENLVMVVLFAVVPFVAVETRLCQPPK